MTLIKSFISALGTFLACMSMAYAAASPPLTADDVERFIESMPESMALGEKYDQGRPENIDPTRPMTSGVEAMDPDEAMYKELEQLVSRHGFASIEQWADVGDRTMLAYMVVSSGGSVSDIQMAYQLGIDNIKNSPGLSHEQKQAILAGMEKSHQRNRDMLMSADQDVAAVRPHKGKLDALFN